MMRSSLSGLLALGLIALTGFSPAVPPAHDLGFTHTATLTATADTVHVAPPTGEQETDRASILAALEEVEPGGTVQFAPGTYLVGTIMPVPQSGITLQAHPSGTTLRGCDPGEAGESVLECGVMVLQGGGVALRGFTIEQSQLGVCISACRGDPQAPVGDTVGGYRIEDNIFRNSLNGVRGQVVSSDTSVIRDNRFINTFHAVSFLEASHLHVVDNRISAPEPAEMPGLGHVSFAIAVGGNSNLIARNRIEGHPDGILLAASPGLRTSGNVIRENAIAVARNRLPDGGSPALASSDSTDSTIVGVPLALHGLRAPRDTIQAGRLSDNLVQDNRILGAEGIGIELTRASGNRIIGNHVSGIVPRRPFPGNSVSTDPEPWREANGSGIWVSADSDGNDIVDNTFEDVAGEAVLLEGDDNRVELQSAADSVKDLGSGNRVTVRAVMEPSGSQECRQPLELDDGWITAAPEDLGLACAPLVEMTEAIRRDDYRNVHAVLVAKDGRLVYEEYFTGTDRRPESSDYSATVTHTFDRNTLHTIRSAGKSFTSALVGVALASGAIPSVERPLLEFFPELADVADPAAREITLEHVLTMSAGFDWNQGDVPYTDPANHESSMSRSDDPARFVLSREVVDEPGSRWEYNSGLPTLLGLIIHRTTEQAFGAYAREHLFAPLGVQRVDWTGPPAWADHPAFVWDGDESWRMTRSAHPAGSLWLLPRDMLKFGQLYLEGGRWNGRQVLPEGWVAASLEPRVSRSGRPNEYPNGAVRHAAYGYQWWYDRFELPYGDVAVHSASGNGGQKIWVVPELGVTAVHLAGNYNVPGFGWEAERLLLERIVPWAMGIRSTYRHQPSLAPVTVDPERWPLVELPDADRARYLGSYEDDGQRIEIRELDDRLQLLPPIGMGPLDLIPRGDHAFALGLVEDGEVRRIYTPEERYVFVFDDKGRVVRYEVRGPQGVVSIGERLPRDGAPKDRAAGSDTVRVAPPAGAPVVRDSALADSVLALTRELAASWTRLEPDDYLNRFSDDLEFYFGLREVMTDFSGEVTDLRGALSQVWERREGAWLVVRAHESLPPADGGR